MNDIAEVSSARRHRAAGPDRYKWTALSNTTLGVFWINVPIGAFGTIWAYRKLREVGSSRRTSIDWWGNVTFGAGLILILIGLTYGLLPHGTHSMGWTGPWVLLELAAGLACLAVFLAIFPHLITGPFLHGLRIAFTASLAMCLVAAWASWMRGARYVHDDDGDAAEAAEAAEKRG
ncbi:MAG TPA: hypothetical protein VFV02_01800, partial [Acidimicrobiales bacterium]|nr:hypothetical protein [Acidimicrobiales bacterium]